MTGPAITEPDPLEQLKAMRSQPAPKAAPTDDPLEQLKAMRGPQTTADKLHAEYKAGTLGRRMARENANDAESAGDGGASSTLGAFGQSLAATGANIAQGIPGMRAAQAGIRSIVRRQPYREALSDIDNATGKIPGVLRVGEQVAGAAPLAAILPGGAAASGAIVGGADQALNADPDMSLGERGARTVAGAATGAFVGKTLDKASTIARALATKSPADKLIQMQAERAASAKQLYSKALAEGQGAHATPMIQQYLAEPDVAEIVSELQGTRQFAGKDPHSPEMLDAIYKTLSDRAGAAKKGLDALTPNRPNIGRFRLNDIKDAQRQGLDAMSGGSLPGPMPSYRSAVEDFAQRSQEIEALQKGYETVRAKLSGGLPSAKNLTRKTPQAFAEWAKTASPEEIQAARQGILGATKDALSQPGKTFAPGRRAAGVSANLLHLTPTTSQTMLEGLQNLGLLTAGNSTTTP